MGNILTEDAGPTKLEEISIRHRRIAEEAKLFLNPDWSLPPTEKTRSVINPNWNLRLSGYLSALYLREFLESHPNITIDDIAVKDGENRYFLSPKVLPKYADRFYMRNHQLMPGEKPQPILDNIFAPCEGSGDIEQTFSASYSAMTNSRGSKVGIFVGTANTNHHFRVNGEERLFVEMVVDIRNLDNPAKFNLLHATEFSRNETDEDKGHFDVSFVNNTDQFEYHRWFLPNKKRKPSLKKKALNLSGKTLNMYETPIGGESMIELPGAFKSYITGDRSHSNNFVEDKNPKQIFEWINSNYRCGAYSRCIHAEEEGHENVCTCSRMLDEVLERPESKAQREAIDILVKRMERMSITADIERDVDARYRSHPLYDIIVWPDEDRVSKGGVLIKALNVGKFESLVKDAYDEYFMKTDYEYAPDGQRLFSVFYDHIRTKSRNPRTNEFGVFQLYVHRPSSTLPEKKILGFVVDDYKFEAYLHIVSVDRGKDRDADTDNNQNANHNRYSFIIKINELERYDNGRGSYTIELFNYANMSEYHFQNLEADHDVMITLPKLIRDNMPHNLHLPEYIDIYTQITNPNYDLLKESSGDNPEKPVWNWNGKVADKTPLVTIDLKNEAA